MNALKCRTLGATRVRTFENTRVFDNAHAGGGEGERLVFFHMYIQCSNYFMYLESIVGYRATCRDRYVSNKTTTAVFGRFKAILLVKRISTTTPT